MRLVDLLPECGETLKKRLADGSAISMTDATEVIFGTSGRGSQKAKLIIQELSRRKVVAISQRGRAQYVMLPQFQPPHERPWDSPPERSDDAAVDKTEDLVNI